MLNKEIPFLRIGTPLCVGIISGRWLDPGSLFLITAGAIVLSGFCISLIFNKYLVNLIYGYTLTIALFVSGFLLYENEKSRLSTLRSETATYSCTLSEYPEEKGNSLRAVLKLNSLAGENGNIPLRGSLLIYFRKDSFTKTPVPGDNFTLMCTPRPVVNRGNPDEFDYKFYLENRGIKYSGFAGKNDIIDHSAPDHLKLIHRALIIREKIIDMYRQRGITGERLALVAAITLGEKSMLDEEQKLNFIKAGVMHIMAVSGLHAVILSLFVFNLLFFLKGKSNIIRILITVLFLWMFAFVTGLTPSVLRATLMFSVVQAGKLMARNVNTLNSVLASAVVLMIIRPSVVFDAGFLLSYSAVIFIVCFYQDLYMTTNFKRWLPDKIWQSAAVTLVAQAGTLPLTISLFNRFPAWFIITNLIIVPVSSLLIIIACLVPLTFPVVFVSRAIASALDFLTGLTALIAEKASSLPMASIENIGISSSESFLLFGALFLTLWYLMHRRSFTVTYTLISLLLFFIAGLIKDFKSAASSELIVYNTTTGHYAVGVRNGRTVHLYSDTLAVPAEVQRHCSTRGLKIRTFAVNGKALEIEAGKSRVLIAGNARENLLRLRPDYLVLTGSKGQIKGTLKNSGRVRAVILTSERPVRSGWYSKPAGGNIDSVHFCRISGAYRAKL
ncbi:MAG: ComEC/Rec2 family competence protein [Bacteroidales bacterium]